MKSAIYMDYHSTTPVDKRVVETMLPYLIEHFGNPASRQHQFGWITEQAVEFARKQLASAIGAQPKEIVFTSGATESNNLALKGIAAAWQNKGNHIVTVQTEHKSVMDVCKRLEASGFDVTYLPVNYDGLIDLNRLKEVITPKTILVSVMAANNEIGTLQSLAEIGQICREQDVFFHTDATQALGKVPINVESVNIDLLSLSSHKIYGPKGIGVLYIRNIGSKTRLVPQIDGGGHERGLRSGTLNVPGIVGLGKAIELSMDVLDEESRQLAAMRDRLWNGLQSQLDDVFLNGHPTNRLPNNLNASFLHVDSSALMMSMKDIALSNGSACSTASPEPSHVLKALRLPHERLHSAIRFGLGRFTTNEEVEYVIGRVVESVRKLRLNSPTYKNKHAAVSV